MKESGDLTVVERLRAQLRGLVQEVPPELEMCEFFCGRSSCQGEDWDRCLLRKSRPASLN